MNTVDVAARSGLSRKAAIILAVVTTGAFLCLLATAPHRAEAWNGVFCNGWVAPFGQNGDRCAAPQANWENTLVGGFGRTHSMCVNAYDQYGQLHTNWSCTPGPSHTVNVWYGGGIRSVRGVARNNNTGAPNDIYACQNIC